MTEILEVKDIHKSYKKLKAVDGVSFNVKKGTCFGLLGPNGAGKSTTIEIIESVTRPDSGEILLEKKALDKAELSRLGIQFQETALPPKLTIREALSTFSNLYENSLDIDEVIDLCQIRDFQNQLHENVSGGQRQRLLLAMALCHNPDVVLLDEPTTGLDPQARRHLWDIVKRIKREGKSIILTTHYMDEAYELCDEIGIMDQGKIIALGTPRELLDEHCKGVIIELPENPETYDLLKTKSFYEDLIHTDKRIELVTNQLNATLLELSKLNLDLTGMTIRHSNLEDLFLKLTGKELRA